MKRDCLQVEEEIWEHVRGGSDLSESARRHIEECGECMRALREAGQIQHGLHAVRHTPDAPDCRSAVLAGVTGRKTVPAWGWAGAFAAVLVAVVIAWSMLGAPQTEPQDDSVQKIVKKAPVERAPVEEPQKQIATNDEQAESGNVQTPKHEDTRVKKHYRPRPKKLESVKQTVEDPVVVQKQETVEPEAVVAKEEPAEDPHRPVAIAIVKWPSQLDGEEELDYSYTQRNEETGEMTTCVARRSGNSVEIYMETKKEENEPKTIKGSVDNEADRNA